MYRWRDGGKGHQRGREGVGDARGFWCSARYSAHVRPIYCGPPPRPGN